jgi:hypothetical protein
VVLNLRNENRSISKRQKVKLEPGAIVDVQFEVPQLARGLWQGRATLEVVDDLPFDNQRHLAIMVAPQYRVLIVDGDPHASPYSSETYFLESALRLAQTGILFDPISGGTAEPGLRRRNGNGVVLTEGHVHPHLVIGDMATWQATDPTARL